MPEVLTANSFENIEFPRQISLIKKLRFVSFLINDVILLGSFFFMVLPIAALLGIHITFIKQLSVPPFTPVLFIFSAIPLLFGAKRHLVSSDKDAEKDEHAWWSNAIPLLFAGITSLGGFINVVSLSNSGVFSLFHTSTFAGLCFFLIGLALIPPFTQFPHRFHITHFLIFIVSGLSVFIVLENTYQLFSSLPAQHMFHVPFLTAIVFVFLCFGIILRWSNRGFFGNFTLDSTVSTFALRLFLLNLFSAPLIACIVLFTIQNTSYNMYQAVTVIVVLFTSISSTLLWINVKLLYKYDLEHVLMRESLRTHNIDLTAEKDELQKRMTQLEQEKQQYADKLQTQTAWQNIADNLR